ncbi:MAG TPA: (p)ppGpp synthetase [Firmicutes bacterium]|jgi:GTP pyrophosphokinase|nr:(p)ppGpp synthetase [Bacillota bacterium]HBG44115.1 (p)ppGpp synthetase [Bacillota bacterium]HBL50087.1 (p)ppGpp synthetase [Bacillota bacterium]HBL67199.1 (p)ppGpp synthetase [Bacillota bacterium]HCF91055.1 (p)ppGpp synthetase [Bacillota bacterium]
MSLENLIKTVKSYSPSANTKKLEEVYDFAAKAHKGQKRDSGDAYIQHPLNVAQILAEMEMDLTTLCAAILHDVVEDTDVLITEIEAKFGAEVAMLVDGVTKLSKIDFQTREERQAENLRKMFLAMAKDFRVVLIKLADRMHNMNTLKYLPEDRQRRIAQETLDIYAPLAHRLGMWKIKWELEDLAFRYFDPTEYYRLVHMVAKKRREREGYLDGVMVTLNETLRGRGIEADIQGRPKHFYSIYNKMKRENKAFAEIFDLLGLRVIVSTVKDCYAVLGEIHNLWKPIPGRFKDYIAMPKSNMYQSLHTTVIGPNGEPLEIQIRTKEMHETAEFGMAAHWRYKEGAGAKDFEDKFSWLRHLLEWQRESGDPEEFLESLRIDLFMDEVFVFTPRGDVKSLQSGSTPVDFAYTVHTDVGNRCIGAKVNGKLVPLDYKLVNGDIIEIVTSKQATGPSLDWLAFVQSSKAKSKIRQWFREERRDEDLAHGRELLEKELRKQGLEVSENLKQDKLLEGAKRLGFLEAEDLVVAVGSGKVSAGMAVGRIIGDRETVQQPIGEEEKEIRQTSDGLHGIRVQGVSNLLVRLSRCCSPLPGDEIVGYVTRGRGVSIHRKDCPNLTQENPGNERYVEVEWDAVSAGSYPVDVDIEAVDRTGLLADVVNALAEIKAPLMRVNAQTGRSRLAHVSLTVEVNHIEHLNNILKRIRRVDGVLQAYRGGGG